MLRKEIVVVALLISALPFPARGEGALAVGIPDDGMHRGFAYGYKLNAESAEDARKQALADCREAASKNKVPPGKCRIVESFKKGCLAVSIDTKGQWAGWVVSKDEKSARSRALGRCKVGGVSCEVAAAECEK